MNERRRRIPLLLKDLRDAIQRPLLEEVVLCESKLRRDQQKSASSTMAASSVSPDQQQQLPSTLELDTAESASQTSSRSTGGYGKRSRTDDKRPKRSWSELLLEAADLLPFLTDKEHGMVLRYAAIMLLGFFLPLSTGNEFVLLQNATLDKDGGSSNKKTELDIAQYLFNMELEERLESCLPYYSSVEYGETDTLTDLSVDLAFDTFLRNGLARLLAGRPAHKQEVDLTHVLAMAIDPRPSDESMSQTMQLMEGLGHPAWTRARRLMENACALRFQVNYERRVQLTRLVAEHLVLPLDPDDDDDIPVAFPLLDAARVHLRASLRAFSLSARYAEDSHLALSALVSVACQSRNAHIVFDEWDYQLHRMVEDRTDYGCKNCHQSEPQLRRLVQEPPPAGKPNMICPHSARGRFLASFISQFCQSRQDDFEHRFIKHTASSLSDAVEWQVDCWNKDSSDPAKLHAPCLLASLLLTAREGFYFYSEETLEKVDYLYDHFESLIQSAVQLMNHSNQDVVNEASALLMCAFRFCESETVTSYALFLLEALKKQLERETLSDAVDGLVAVLSQHSSAFASSLYSHLIDSYADSNHKVAAFRLLACVASNCPLVVAKDSERLMNLLRAHETTKNGLHVIACLLSSRQARYFSDKSDPVVQVICNAVEGQPDRWGLYQLAGHALVTGNFLVANKIYSKILSSDLSESTYLWMSLLSNMSRAEYSLSIHAAKGIPDASILLRSGLSLLQSFTKVYKPLRSGFTFQMKFILLRLDFLDLLTILRQLTREMRLTGKGPAKHTRAHMHLQNTVKSFVALSSRYRLLYREHGMRFKYVQSRKSLRSLQDLCLFVAVAARSVFSDLLASQIPEISTPAFPKLSHHPMTRLLHQLNELVVEPMSASLNPLVRAAALLELIDGILMIPTPFPRDFLSPVETLVGSLHLCPDPEQTVEWDAEEMNVVEALPGLCFTFHATGCIPESLLAESKDTCWTVLLCYRFIYDGPLSEDDMQVDEKEDEDGPSPPSRVDILKKMPNLSTFSPVTTRIFPDGSFFVPIECPPLTEEGFYTIEVKLACRDIAGAEWDIPIDRRQRTLPVRVSRSR